jgi:hypothetical protein
MGSTLADEHLFTVTYASPVVLDALRWIEGDHDQAGGWASSLAVEIRRHGMWLPVATTSSTSLDPLVPFQIIDLQLDQFAQVQGIRVRAFAGGSVPTIELAELDGLLYELSAEDIDQLQQAVQYGSLDVLDDLNGDGAVSEADVLYLLTDLLNTRQGDANLDQSVDVGDLGILAANFGSAADSWANADFNADGAVDVGDLGILAANFGLPTSLTTVPEPAAALLLPLAGLLVFSKHRCIGRIEVDIAG